MWRIVGNVLLFLFPSLSLSLSQTHTHTHTFFLSFDLFNSLVFSFFAPPFLCLPFLQLSFIYNYVCVCVLLGVSFEQILLFFACSLNGYYGLLVSFKTYLSLLSSTTNFAIVSISISISKKEKKNWKFPYKLLRKRFTFTFAIDGISREFLVFHAPILTHYTSPNRKPRAESFELSSLHSCFVF